ncbi:MurR/RpiR family transcriptional regulator [Nocardia crassostreae]|uniref:MurR/RpiR family transcriptional regulator n=1 Tax=Nocardia crassostreae TaxID=53428 RepID=UPI000AFE109D|nr:MurR/RpiR family transcriptional regulator [Nocardia crassostreae]
MREAWEGLSKAERTVSDLLVHSTAERILYASAAELGTESSTSNATVVRTLQKLGYAGLSDLKQQVAGPFTAATAPEVRLRQRIDHLGDNYDAISSGVWTEALDRIELARTSLRPDFIAAVVDLVLRTRRTHTYGLGASAIAADHLALRLNRIGHPARRITADGFRLPDELLFIAPSDVLFLFAPGRMIPELDVILTRARDVDAKVVLLSDDPTDPLADRVTVHLTAPHTPAGLTAEALTSLLVSDIIVQAVIAVAPDRAVEASHTLTTLRSRMGY